MRHIFSKCLKSGAFLSSIYTLVSITASAQAMPQFSYDNLEVSAAYGFAQTTSNSPQIYVSNHENDQLVVNKVSSTPVYKLGIGYTFLNQLLVELNYYGGTESVKGNVWQYQSEAFNNYSFNTSIRSKRLMLDIKPNLFTLDRVSFYPILGVGMAWNSSAYTENYTTSDAQPNSATLLNTNTKASPAYDLGAGFSMKATQKLNLSIEYIYSNLGTVELNNMPTNGGTLNSPPRFKLHNQDVLFGASWSFR